MGVCLRQFRIHMNVGCMHHMFGRSLVIVQRVALKSVVSVWCMLDGVVFVILL